LEDANIVDSDVEGVVGKWRVWLCGGCRDGIKGEWEGKGRKQGTPHTPNHDKAAGLRVAALAV